MKTLKTLNVIALLSMAPAILAQTATVAKVTTGNPEGAKVAAVFAGAIKGTVRAGSDPFGIGVNFHVELSGLPEADGPYAFHLHQLPVPADGNCTGTGGHLDPFGRTNTPACDASAPATCEVGDLSGKYGKLTKSTSMARYAPLRDSRPFGKHEFED
jgi:hypothetical protein